MNLFSNPYLKTLCIVLLLYSIIGGLIVPLSPNIERVSYKIQGDSVLFEVSIPKINESIPTFYLKQNTLKQEKGLILKSSSVTKEKKLYKIAFINPNIVVGVNENNSFDLIAPTESSGQMTYFSAYYAESIIATKKIQSTIIPESIRPFQLSFPNKSILKESIRNLFYHVPMWFSMIGLLIYSLIMSIKYLAKGQQKADIEAENSAKIGMIFGVLGLLTGMIWAKYTWGAFWTNDPKLNGTAIGMLAYLAYFILRNSIEDEVKKARLAAVYNIFAFTLYMVFIMILPRINDSLHPGNGGNPGFNIYEQDNIMRLFFYPAVIGWLLMAFWLKEIYVKAQIINQNDTQ